MPAQLSPIALHALSSDVQHSLSELQVHLAVYDHKGWRDDAHQNWFEQPKLGEGASPRYAIEGCEQGGASSRSEQQQPDLREPGREDAETIATGSQAAAMGGFTCVHTMANTSPVADTAGVVEQVWRRGVEAGIGAGGARERSGRPLGKLAARRPDPASLRLALTPSR